MSYRQQVVDNFNSRFEQDGYAEAIAAIAAFAPVTSANLHEYDDACEAASERFGQGIGTVVADAYRAAGY